MLSQDNRPTKLPPTYLAGISVDFIHETSQFTRWQHHNHYIGGKPKKNILLNESAKMILGCLHGTVCMIIVCHLSYQDSEAIVHMKQNAILPTEQQYNHNATETLIIDN